MSPKTTPRAMSASIAVADFFGVSFKATTDDEESDINAYIRKGFANAHRYRLSIAFSRLP
jgi:hypothetical protein